MLGNSKHNLPPVFALIISPSPFWGSPKITQHFRLWLEGFSKWLPHAIELPVPKRTVPALHTLIFN